MAKDISIDISGNLYITGYFEQNIYTLYGNFESEGDEDIFLASYTNDGQLRWMKTVGSTWPDFGNGKIEIIKADPMPIGIGAIEGRDFAKNEITLRKGDLIYLYTDGFEDQFGGERDKKFSRKQFRELLLSIHSLPMSEQKSTLEKRLEEWMNGREQIDDVTVMGIRF